MVYAMDPNNSVIKRLWCKWMTEKSEIGAPTPLLLSEAEATENYNSFRL